VTIHYFHFVKTATHGQILNRHRFETKTISSYINHQYETLKKTIFLKRHSFFKVLKTLFFKRHSILKDALFLKKLFLRRYFLAVKNHRSIGYCWWWHIIASFNGKCSDYINTFNHSPLFSHMRWRKSEIVQTDIGLKTAGKINSSPLFIVSRSTFRLWHSLIF